MRNKPGGKLFDHPSDMEPLLPEDGDGGFPNLYPAGL